MSSPHLTGEQQQGEAVGRLAIMGEIEVRDPDASLHTYPIALLVTFKTPEEARKAIMQGRCSFVWGDE